MLTMPLLTIPRRLRNAIEDFREFVSDIYSAYQRWKAWKRFEATLTPFNAWEDSSEEPQDILQHVGYGRVRKYQITQREDALGKVLWVHRYLPTASFASHRGLWSGVLPFEDVDELVMQESFLTVWDRKRAEEGKLYYMPKKSAGSPITEELYF